MQRMRLNRGAGFTLVEMLLVLVILATLAAIVIPKMAGRSKQAQVTAAQSQIKSFETMFDSFEVDNGYFPTTADGFLPLMEQPANAPNWKGPYIKEVPVDPWQSPYNYVSPGQRDPNGYDISSNGPDRQAGNEDDIYN